MRIEIDAQLIDLIRKRVFADFFRFQWAPRSISRRRFDWLSLDDFRSSIAIIQIVKVNIDALVITLGSDVNKLVERTSSV